MGRPLSLSWPVNEQQQKDDGCCWVRCLRRITEKLWCLVMQYEQIDTELVDYLSSDLFGAAFFPPCTKMNGGPIGVFHQSNASLFSLRSLLFFFYRCSTIQPQLLILDHILGCPYTWLFSPCRWSFRSINGKAKQSITHRKAGARNGDGDPTGTPHTQ